MYKTEEITPSEWEIFQKKQSFTLDVQSVEYGNFYTSINEKSIYIAVKDANNNILAGSLVVSVHAKRGDFLYLPYGPIVNEDTKKDQQLNIFKSFFSHLKHYGKQHSYAFIRISPFWDNTKENQLLLNTLGLRPAPMHVLAETTWLNNLNRTETELFSAMNKNHRNLIRRLEREGVQTKTFTDSKNLEMFQDLLDETAKRHHFIRFSRSYITREFQAYEASGKARLILGYLPDGTLDAGAIIYLHGSMAAYRHGASLGQNKRLPVSYLVQWQGIREAQKQGKIWYNFWGIAPNDKSKKHPFLGITHFKKGFGGQQKDLVHCHDLPISNRYWISWIIETVRKTKRGF